MTEYHTVYKGNGETTQWDDIHRKLGNLPAKAPVWKPERYRPGVEQAHDKQWADTKDVEELSEVEDEFQDDRFMEQYRRKRIHELQHAVHRPRFGTVEEIRAAEFVQKVTDASQGPVAAQPALPPTALGDVAGQAQPGQQQAQETQEPIWVIVQLYKDGHGGSALMSKCIDELAVRYPATKFVRIVSTQCIPNYPDANVPTLLVYHGGTCIKHLAGLSLFGGQRATPEQVALVLNQLGAVCCTNPNEDEEGEGGEVRLAGGGENSRLVRQLVQRVVMEREDGDESSDFES
mmetsp:Transcript_22148/g.37837  ORF Transcript_22148/g.37837 Transcript_22148/m.37837 type:complete len:290 (-) Transcript_22148:483-1352(-)|eukprot:CAMPEP_0119101220 /NCGR_PEP_ID=MMETSP1180-20130426/331_1 /TAXON_ID=3052 ORGANISM="Chlamydomonas cf sp, Strain CCMP681" /NCGR_SAMPLE_ID=MMETSP1180 /ASSEMBLY_ACC=CAM_ASM_000741 /LENGTH=289 /DNA_ID=CAMNT_0007085305 /DNA_START=139 /DNA_END=1008 /DNA_ORIENTATION=+